MNKAKVIIIVLTVLTVIGWGVVGLSKGSDNSEYNANVEQADAWVKDGLYQRAILKYEEVILYNDSEENWTKMITAYQKRYDEDKNIMSDYIVALQEALDSYPDNSDFTKKIVNLYIANDDYDSAYKYIEKAISSGVNDKEIFALGQKVRYQYDLDEIGVNDFYGISGDSYTIYNGEFWGAIYSNGDSNYEDDKTYLSRPNEDGVVVITRENDSRIYDDTGMVLGIFPFTVTEAGVCGSDLLPVKKGEKYIYFDMFAKEVFGSYDYAGKFVGGVAAVKTGNKWSFIGTDGKSVKNGFIDIKLDGSDSYIPDEIIVASTQKGVYETYNADFEKIASFKADDADICTKDGLIAFKQGNKWGFVDTEGNVIIKPQFDEAKSFSNGLAAVCKNNLWGFIDSNGIVVIDYTFAGADYFNSEGCCMVRTDGPESENDEIYWDLLKLELGILN